MVAVRIMAPRCRRAGGVNPPVGDRGVTPPARQYTKGERLVVVLDHLAAGPRDQGGEGGDGDLFVDEADVTVAKDGVDPAGMEAVDLPAAIDAVDRVRVRSTADVLAVGAVDPARAGQVRPLVGRA